MAKGLPPDLVEDAISTAKLAVLLAEKSYDPGKGARPTTWAWYYVQWKVGEFVRQ